MYLSIVFMLSILLWVIYLYIYYIMDMYIYILYIIGFLKFSDLIRLSRPVFGFPYRPPGACSALLSKYQVFLLLIALLDKLDFVQKSVRLQNNDFPLFFAIFSNTFCIRQCFLLVICSQFWQFRSG